jgi:hypothetical protein
MRKSRLSNLEMYLDTPEGKVSEEAAILLKHFRLPYNQKKQNWNRDLNIRVQELILDCYDNNLEPIPHGLIELIKEMLGKTKANIWPIEKYYVLSCIALTHDPVDLDTKETGFITYMHKCLDEAGGIRKNKILTKSDYRKSVREWLKDEEFQALWAIKRARHLKLINRQDYPEIIEVTRKAVRKRQK